MGRFSKFYQTKEWKATRNYYIELNPLCEECLRNDIITPGVDIDHIQPLATNYELRLDLNNLQTLCKRCHQQKSANEKKELYKPHVVKTLNKKWNLD